MAPSKILAATLLITAAAGCSRAPRLELSSAQVSDALRASIEDLRQDVRNEAQEGSRLAAHYAWLGRNGAVPVDQASDREKELARAVVRISDIQGSTGTGFFVSPDGLLLTNEHVVESSNCSRERCSGYRFVRGFSAQGDFEVFERAYPVAFSYYGSDFALLQIELPPGRTVPFLQLEFGDVREAVKRGGREGTLRLIGHPFSSPARILPVNPTGIIDQVLLTYTSLGAPGTSGGPIVDISTGHVVALNSLLEDNLRDEITFDGELRRTTNRGWLTSEILYRLRRAYPELENRPSLVGSEFSNWAGHASERRVRSLMTPPSDETFHPEVPSSFAEFLLSPAERRALRSTPDHDGPDAGGFFFHFYGTRYAEERWSQLIEELLANEDPNGVISVLYGMADAHRSTGVPVPMTEEQLVALNERLQTFENVNPKDLIRSQLTLAREMGVEITVDGQSFDCPAFVAAQQGYPLELAILLAQICGTREMKLTNGETVSTMEILLSALTPPAGQSWNDDAGTSLAMRSLEQLAKAAPWKAEELALAKRITGMLIERSPTWAAISRIETLALRLERQPHSLTPGGDGGLFDSSRLPSEDEVSTQLERLRSALLLPEPEPITETD